MSKNDDNNGIPDRPSFLGGGRPGEHQSYGQNPQGDEKGYMSPISPKPNDQSEYSQVGGKRNSNQPYSSGQQQNGNYGQPLDNQGYPTDDHGDYSQSPYSQGGAGRPSQPGYDYQQGYSQGSQEGYGEAGNPGYGQQQYQQDPQAEGYAGYQQSSYDQSGYAYPGGQNEGYNYGDQGYNDQQGMEDTSFLSNEYPDEGYQEQRPKKGKSPLMIGALMGILLVGGGVGYAFNKGMFSFGDNSANVASTSPLLISRDNTPVKERPTEAGGTNVPHKNKEIYERLSGKPADNSNRDTRLSSRSEQVNDARDNSVPGMSVAGNESDRAGRPTSVRTIKIIPVTPSGGVGEKKNDNPLAGFSVSNSSAESSGNRRPRDPGIINQTLTSVNSSENTSSIGEPQRPIRKVENRQQIQPVQRPVQRETNNQQVASLPQENRTGNTRSFTPPDQSVGEVAGNGFVVQIAARREHSDALAAFVDMRGKYPGILSELKPIIQKADLTAKGKGIWYRLRVGPMSSKQAANDVCEQLKSQGYKSCFVPRQ